MLLMYNSVLLKMSTWYSKHVEESNNIWRINNIQCITLVILYDHIAWNSAWLKKFINYDMHFLPTTSSFGALMYILSTGLVTSFGPCCKVLEAINHFSEGFLAGILLYRKARFIEFKTWSACKFSGGASALPSLYSRSGSSTTIHRLCHHVRSRVEKRVVKWETWNVVVILKFLHYKKIWIILISFIFEFPCITSP